MSQEIKGERWLSPAEVGRIFNVKPRTVNRWAAAGRLSFRVTPSGRRQYREADIARLAAGRAANS